MTQGFESVISTIKDASAVRIGREFKAKLKLLTLAHDPLVEDIIHSSNYSVQGISEFAREDADKAIARAEELYAWAGTFLPDITQATLNRQAKLELMPYIVAMAYAVRVKLDAQLVKSTLLPEAKRSPYLKRACGIVDEFVRVLQAAIMAVTVKTSLLEIALDYHQSLATYVTLISTLRSSTHMMLLPADAPAERVALWDDGLAEIRYGAGQRRGDQSDAPVLSPYVLTPVLLWSQGHPLPRGQLRHNKYRHPARQRQGRHLVGAVYWKRLGKHEHERAPKHRRAARTLAGARSQLGKRPGRRGPRRRSHALPGARSVAPIPSPRLAFLRGSPRVH